MSTKDWCDDADAWNSDDDDDDDKQSKKEKKTSPVIPKVEQQPEIELNSMTIEDDNEKSSTDEEEEVEIDKSAKRKEKPIPVASSDAFSEWKKKNLTKPTLDVSNDASFPFYYIVIDDEKIVIDEAKLNETKKLKNKVKTLNDIDEDGDDEPSKGGKEFVLFFLQKHLKN